MPLVFILCVFVTSWFNCVPTPWLGRLAVMCDCGITVLPTKSVSDKMFCLQLLSKTLTSTLHLS